MPKTLALSLVFASLAGAAGTAGAEGGALAKWGPTWSEVSGERWNLTILNRRPTSFQTIDGWSNYPTYPVKLEPGEHVIRLSAPAPRWRGGSEVNSMTLTLEPCMRYYLVAQFDNPTGPDFTPVVDYVERISGCSVPAG